MPAKQDQRGLLHLASHARTSPDCLMHLWLVAALAAAFALSALPPSLSRGLLFLRGITTTFAGIFLLGVTYMTDLLRRHV